MAALRREAPPLAEVDQVVARRMAPLDQDGPDGAAASFRILASDATGRRRTDISADSATCEDCLRELFDPADRRYRYPFVNCTNCGPRLTIVRDVPYDRPMTTMAGFRMCPACEAEYHDPADRRFHAQPTCCPACGPTLRFVLAGAGAGAGAGSGGAADAPTGADALRAAASLLCAGGVVAVKGLGGYHLAVRADDETAAATLRMRKHREDKPFALMVADLDAARELCEVDDTAARLLTSRRRPVVLLRRRAEPDLTAPPVAAAVAPGRAELGVMLPYTPLHHLLVGTVPGPIVLTSGNVSDEPIAYRDADALRRLGRIADAFLTHDRPIEVRTDDSVVRVLGDRESVVRRARGYAPEPLGLPWEFSRPVLACGAELKNTFCLGRGPRAYVSGHVGDLENYETLRSFVEGVQHYQRLFEVQPEVLAHDLHPEYLSTKYALDRADAEGLAASDLIGVQHHHAHIASCLADNRHSGPVLGVAFDGLGYGLDGTLWGGEFLLADVTGFTRLAHFEPVPMPGGTVAIRQPWRMAAAYLEAAGIATDADAGLGVVRRNAERWPEVVRLAGSGSGSAAGSGVGVGAGGGVPRTSSVGRLFDAVAALLDVRDSVTYEGQAAIELEQFAAVGSHAGYPVAVGQPPAGGALRISGSDVVRAVLDDVRRGVAAPVVAARFHSTLARIVVTTCVRLRDEVGDEAWRAAAESMTEASAGRVRASTVAAGTVALSGGVFGNARLFRETVVGLNAAGFRVLTHSRVPCNDGGLSLGQAVVASARAGRIPHRTRAGRY